MSLKVLGAARVIVRNVGRVRNTIWSTGTPQLAYTIHPYRSDVKICGAQHDSDCRYACSAKRWRHPLQQPRARFEIW